MKRVLLLSLTLFCIYSTTVQALSWEGIFVVWKGKVYVSKQEDVIEQENQIKEGKIGKVIGEVKTEPNERGSFYGNASNYYPIGTKYYEIKGIPTSKAIAIQDGNHWVKAIYAHKAPFHIMNLLTNTFFLTAVAVLALFVIRSIIGTQYAKHKR